MFMQSQNINKFWSGKLGLRSALDYSQYWDFQVGEDDYILRRLKHPTEPIIWFDSDSGSTINCGDKGVEIDSLIRWTNAPASAFTINDIGLTEIDTQYVDQMSGISVSFFGAETLVLKMVDGNLLFDNANGLYPIKYDIVSMDDYSGQYYKGDGGFFQGFWKLYDYPFELMPTRMTKGWTMEFLLKVGCCDCNTCQSSYEQTLNEIYPGNRDIFFLIGTRAENKYWNYFSGESGVTTSSGVPLNPESGATEPPVNSFMYWNEILPISSNDPNDNKPSPPYDNNFTEPVTCGNKEPYQMSPAPNKDPNFDIINNVLAFRLDCQTNKIGYRKVAFSGVCTYDFSGNTTGGTHMEALAVIEEKMSDDPIEITGTCSGQTWAHVVVKFVREYTLEGCDLVNRGGINDINYDDVTTYLKLLNYENEANWRKGKLIFYVNGKKHFVVDDFEEIIPRQLDTDKEKQQGVPFNISWGGGTQGLMESITFSGWTGGIEQDSQDYQMLMEKNFAGTWCGGYAVLKIYDKPLENFEIINNFCTYMNRFHLKRLICCQCLPNNPYLL